MTYLYKCENVECEMHDEVVEVDKPMAESSRTEYCEKCSGELTRVYTSPAVKPAGDTMKI